MTSFCDSSDAGFASSPSPEINKEDHYNTKNNNNNNKVEGNDLNLALSGFPLSTNSTTSNDSSKDVEMSCDIGWRRLLQVLLLGLLLFLLDVSLQLAVAGRYLALRDCHRGLETTFEDFNLSKVLEETSPLSTTADSSSKWSPDSSDRYRPLKDLISHHAHFEVGSSGGRASLVPDHWLERAHDVVDFQLDRLGGLSAFADVCTINKRSFDNGLEAGAYLCKDALTNAQRMSIADAFHGISPEDESEIIDALLRKANVTEMMLIVPKALGVELPESFLPTVTKLMNVLDEEDLKALRNFVEDPEVADKLGPAMEALASIDSTHLDVLAEAVSQIQGANVPKIEQSLKKLNITLASFLTDPAILMKFLSDQKATEILLMLQSLLPTFGPRTLNSMLVVKDAFDSTPGASDILDKLFSLPMGLFMKVFSVDVKPSEMELLGAIQSNRKLRSLFAVVSDLGLISGDAKSAEEALLKFAARCTHPVVSIHCEDLSADLCPSGHLAYSVPTFVALAIPGILIAISEFIHFRAFRFGVLQSLKGQNLNRVWKYFLLPFYAAFMIPFAIIATTIWYYRMLKKIFLQRSPSVIRECGDEALQMHSVYASAASFLQIVVQVVFLLLLGSAGSGAFVAGVDANTFLANIVPLSAASISVSLLNLLYTGWRLQRLDRRQKSLHLSDGEREGRVAAATFTTWRLLSTVTQVISLTLLSVVLYVESFSGPLSGQPGIDWRLVALLPVLAGFPVGWWIHRDGTREAEPNAYKAAHGAISFIFPLRYLHPTDASQTGRTTLHLQLLNPSCHLAAWLVYSLSSHLSDNSESGFVLLLPLAAALVSLGPAAAAVHWAKSVETSYPESAALKRSGTEVVIKGEEKEDLFAASMSSRRVPRRWLYLLWQFLTAVSRLTSASLLIFVYRDHWADVAPAPVVRPAVLYSALYFALAVLANVGLHWTCLGQSSGLHRALLSALLPNGFLGTATSTCAKYLVLNVTLNLLLHLTSWLALTFYCWECTGLLDTFYSRLTACFPVAAGFWMAALVATLLVWRLSVRPALEGKGDEEGMSSSRVSPAGSYDVKRIEVESHHQTAWSEKENSVTTKL